MENELVKRIIVQRENASDNEYIITEIMKADGEAVRKGDTILSYESSKAVIEIDSPSDGYIFLNTSEGATVAIGDCIAAVSSRNELQKSFFAHQSTFEDRTEVVERSAVRISNAAKKLMEEHKISVSEFPGFSIISKKDIEDHINKINSIKKIGKEPTPIIQLNESKKVLIIGAGMGAVLLDDIILKTPFLECIGLCDDKDILQGKNVWGIDVIGHVGDVEKLFKKKIFDYAVISVTSLVSRKNIFEKLKKFDIPLINLIDPSVTIGKNAVIGEGNVICGQAKIGPYASIGNNNFLSSYVNIEHHCMLGSHCTFGPGVLLSGNVKIGNSVMFGTGIFIEPNIEIGDYAIIASGMTVTKSVESNQSLKRTK